MSLQLADLEAQRKAFLAQNGGPDKAATFVTCTWKKAAVAVPAASGQGAATPATPATSGLECDKALLVSGDAISTILVTGLPNAKSARVSVVASDHWGPEPYGRGKSQGDASN
ncbi:MAG TPA: hypothetical protein VMM92_00775, partial [Thermoanaerobaculia bacterium]|nr:hypothetical protein [Thermoanaerobaculia bacterium]